VKKYESNLKRQRGGLSVIS